jgi:hypothetical protein
MKKNKMKLFTLRDYLWKKKFGYIFEPQTIDIGWTTVNTHGIITVPPKILSCGICTKNGNIRVPLEQTLHYQWIKDLVDGNDDSFSKENYRKYLEGFCSHDMCFPWTTDEKLNNVMKMVSLYKSDAQKSQPITIITGAPKWKFYICSYVIKIYDGVHRAAIAMALGHRSIRCMVK